MGRPAKPEPLDEHIGTRRPTPGGYFVQFSLGHGQRKGVILRTCPDEASAEKRQRAIAKPLERLRDAGYSGDLLRNTARDSGAADDEAFTLDDADHVMACLPKTAASSAARRPYAQSVRKLLVYAVYPLRLLAAMAIPKGWRNSIDAPADRVACSLSNRSWCALRRASS